VAAPRTEHGGRGKHHHRTIDPLIGDPPNIIIIAGATDPMGVTRTAFFRHLAERFLDRT
jgi:hypothetical protein